MSGQYAFDCKFCGMSFGDNVIELAVHIGKVHDTPRGIKKQNKKSKTK